MLQFRGLGDPCSPGDADYNPNDPICAAFYAPGGTSQPGSCNTDSDCSSGMECNAVSWFCEPTSAQGSNKQGTSSTASANLVLNPASASNPAAVAAALPMSSTKIALVLLAITGAAGIGWVAYSRMKRSKT
jgi:hypothetical protein